MPATAELIFTGDELLRGDTINTNQAFLGSRLLQAGVLCTRSVTLTDDAGDIASALVDALKRRPEVVILSGGLGPTPDDLTREAVAQALGRPLRHYEDLYRRIADVFASYNRPMAASNRKQASLPEGSHPIDFTGTAPGFWLEEGDTLIAALPGPPAELEHMWTGTLEPLLTKRLSRRSGDSDAPVAIMVRKLLLYGIGESALAQILSELPWRGDRVDVGTRAGYSGIDLILRAPDDPGGRSALDEVETRVRTKLGHRVYGTGEDTLASVVGGLLRERGLTLTTAESCTGGLAGKLLTDVPGSSAYYLGGAVAYSNRLKTLLLGVPESLLAAHGAVSPETAASMALGAREQMESDCAVSVTGIAGPDGGTPEKPVGLVYVATAVGEDVKVRQLTLFRSREDIRQRAAHSALDQLRLHLLGAMNAFSDA
ncbi:MAG: competence/damage-inducible protein A [Thermoleophilia bacterium]